MRSDANRTPVRRRYDGLLGGCDLAAANGIVAPMVETISRAVWRVRSDSFDLRVT
jgi:hypothetical protein